MARARNEDKRALILLTSKTLFAQKGFFNTSISDIVSQTGLPVGSIYTYFKNKEEIVKVIVEEGWADLHARLLDHFKSTKDPLEKLQALIETFLPGLFDDLDLINILLAEALDYTRIEEKLEELTKMIFSVLRSLAKNNDIKHEYSKKEMEVALIVYFLGILHAVKLARSTDIGVSIPEIMEFVKKSIEKTMGLKV